MERTLAFDLVRRFAKGPVVSARACWPLEGARVTVLFGPSGSGKTTILRALSGLDRPDSGFIKFDGTTWFDSARRVSVPPQSRRVGLLFQEYALFPHLSVEANIRYGLHGMARVQKQARVAEMAERFGISDVLTRRPAELSGGQRQRVALVRALAPSPRLLLLDEPLSALDAPARASLRGELRHMLEQAGVPAIVVTHDRTEALALGDRLVVMIDGAIRQVGAVHEVFSAPVDADVALAVGTENVFPSRLVRRQDGLVVVHALASPGIELLAVDPGGVVDEVYVCVRAEEIVLEPLDGHDSSARNRLEGVIAARQDEGPLVRITVDCGVRLIALVTCASADVLKLTVGNRILALVKASSIRVIPRTP